MKHSIVKLLEAIRLNRYSDDCGPESPSRDEAMMIIKREWAVTDARLAALERVASAARVVAADTYEYDDQLAPALGPLVKMREALDKLDDAPADPADGHEGG